MAIELEYGSHYRYIPKSEIQSDEIRSQSRSLFAALKHGRPVEVIGRLMEECEKLGHTHEPFLGPEVLLVPMPRSSPLTAGGLWPAEALCTEMVRRGLAAESLPLLERTLSVPKSAFSKPGERPGPKEHYESMTAHKQIVTQLTMTIVDDVVTRGSTMIAASVRLQEAYPEVNIRGFALSRTDREGPFDSVHAPWAGTIDYDKPSEHLSRS